jgi:hypothetical protein
MLNVSQFDQYISLGNLNISSGKCHYCYIYHLCLCSCVCARAILSCVFLKSFNYLANFFSTICEYSPLFWCFWFSCVFCFCSCDGGFYSGFVLYSLLYSMFIMVFFSINFDFFVFGYVFNLFNRYFIPDSSCSFGWHKLFGIVISVWVGFLYIQNSNCLSLQCIVMSR